MVTMDTTIVKTSASNNGQNKYKLHLTKQAQTTGSGIRKPFANASGMINAAIRDKDYV